MDRYCSAGKLSKIIELLKIVPKKRKFLETVRFLCFVKKKRQITGIVLDSIYGIRFLNYLFHDLIENYWVIENVITVIFCLNELLDVFY